jgi:glycosyltransferase involved in cell wall biosynthesis
MTKIKSDFSLGICIPVWNRGNIFLIAFNSLIKQLQGINATIWIFDNGSDQDTKDIIHTIKVDEPHRVIKTFFPQNMGIPYAVNVFAQTIQENCDFAGYRSPQFVLLMDSDAYYKKPIIDLITIAEQYYDVGVVSGHDSIEHLPVKETELEINGRKILTKEKTNERMITMLMRKDEFLLNYPFPHYRNRDVDWEIAQWGPNSIMKRNRKIVVASDYVLHLGIKKSTWNISEEQFESENEINEVRSILEEAAAKHTSDR